jgi:hypothetical protein
MVMTKKDFKELADMLATINDDEERDNLVNRMCEFCLMNNTRFNDGRFREWIRRVRAGEDLKGLR